MTWSQTTVGGRRGQPGDTKVIPSHLSALATRGGARRWGCRWRRKWQQGCCGDGTGDAPEAALRPQSGLRRWSSRKVLPFPTYLFVSSDSRTQTVLSARMSSSPQGSREHTGPSRGLVVGDNVAPVYSRNNLPQHQMKLLSRWWNPNQHLQHTITTSLSMFGLPQ